MSFLRIILFFAAFLVSVSSFSSEPSLGDLLQFRLSEQGLIQNIAQGEALQPLCPPIISPEICLSVTSFALMRQEEQEEHPLMMTSFFFPQKKVSKEKIKKNKKGWRSYRYSQRRFKRITDDQEKDDVQEDSQEYKTEEEIEDDSAPYTIHVNKEDPSQVIIEDESSYTAGDIKIVPTKDIKINSDNQVVAKQETFAMPVTLRLSSNNQDIVCRDSGDSKTEAEAPCVECDSLSHLISFSAIKKAFIKTKEKVRLKVCDADIKSYEENFNKTCQPSKFKDYVKNHLICQSCENKVPPALMLSIMSTESSGKCYAKNRSHRENSLGLFQINTKAHEYDKNKLISDPKYITKAAIKVLNEKYEYVNKSKSSSFDCSQKSSGDDDMNLWRKAVAAYNGGQTRIQRVQEIITDHPLYEEEGSQVSKEEWDQMDEWEKIRLYYFHHLRTQNCESEKCRAFTNSINNLTYTEVILGRSSEGDSLFKKWQNWGKIDLNDNSHCPKKS